MTKTNNRVIQQRTLRWHALGDFSVAPTAQREFRQSWADHLLSIFDPDKLGTPHISIRQDRKFIVDGQHSLDALKRWLGEDWEIQEIQCWTYEGMTEHEEAELFLSLNERKKVPAFDAFVTALTARRPIETDIDRIVTANGQSISSKREYGITAVGKLIGLYSRSDPNTLGMMIRINDGAWGTPGFDAVVIDGVGLFCQRYNSQIDEERAISKLGTVRGGAKGLITKAYFIREKLGQPLAQCLAAATVDAYNSGTAGKKLPAWWKS